MKENCNGNETNIYSFIFLKIQLFIVLLGDQEVYFDTRLLGSVLPVRGTRRCQVTDGCASPRPAPK